MSEALIERLKSRGISLASLGPSPDKNRQPLLDIQDLCVSLGTHQGRVTVLDHISLSLPAGAVVGVLGESGCGKSSLVKTLLGILPTHGQVDSGTVRLQGMELSKLKPADWREAVRGKLAFVPQDPYLAFNPVFTVGQQLQENFRHLPGGIRVYRQRFLDMLEAVQLPDPVRLLKRYPHEFSGGQRQRLLIAAALAVGPQLIVADEPTTALDAMTQVQIMQLMRKLAKEQGVAMLIVSHDLTVLYQVCEQVDVIYAGQTVERGTAQSVINEALHPYTRKLVACHPDRSPAFIGIPGTVPTLANMPSGCRFAPRCPLAVQSCTQNPPPRMEHTFFHEVACPRHAVAEAKHV